MSNYFRLVARTKRKYDRLVPVELHAGRRRRRRHPTHLRDGRKRPRYNGRSLLVHVYERSRIVFRERRSSRDIGQTAFRSRMVRLHFFLNIITRLIVNFNRYKARNAQGQIGLVPRNYLQELSEYLTQPYQERRERMEPAERQPDGMPDRPHLMGKPWYYGNITRNQCDNLLNNHGHDGDFLIRDSETNVSFFLFSSFLTIIFIPRFWCRGSLHEIIEYNKNPAFTMLNFDVSSSGR